MEVASEGFLTTPEVLIMYEIPPADRWRLVAFQRRLSSEEALSFGTEPDAWCNATDKRRTVDCFRGAGVALGHYAASGQGWLLSRDARNVNKDGRRHQFRVVVLPGRYCECASTCRLIPTRRATSHGVRCPDSSPPRISRRSTAASQSPRRDRWAYRSVASICLYRSRTPRVRS